MKHEACHSSVVVLDGETYAKLSGSKKCTNKAIQWISGCRAFVGCQLSAEQKADILEKVGNCLTPEALTLAIGSKTEDSLMMKRAHISVGIQDKHQTNDYDVDYVIHQFRTLSRLLLLHGMSSQRRMFQLRCFVLFESTALRTVQFIWVLSSFVPGLMSSIEIFGHATIYYVNWLTVVWDVLFWIACFLVYGPLYKYRGPNRKQRRPRELITRISHTRLYINASLKILMTFLGMVLIFLCCLICLLTECVLRRGTRNSYTFIYRENISTCERNSRTDGSSAKRDLFTDSRPRLRNNRLLGSHESDHSALFYTRYGNARMDFGLCHPPTHWLRDLLVLQKVW